MKEALPLVAGAPGSCVHHAGVVGMDVLEAVAQCQTWHHRHGVDLEALQICNLAAVGFAVSDKWAWWSQLS